MTTIRRTYTYLLAFAGLAMLTIGIARLAQLLIDIVLKAPLAASDSYVRDTASLYGAATLVGLPAWLLHWLWIERIARRDPTERASALRGLYLYTVLGGTALIAAASATDALRTTFETVLGSPAPGPPLDQVLRPLPFTLLALVTWRAHWLVAARDRQRVGEGSSTATLRRWYLYGLAFVGFVMLLPGASAVLEGIWRMLAALGALDQGAVPGVDGRSAPTAAAIVGLSLWLAHWVVLPTRLPEPSSRDDGTAVLRSVSLFLALAFGVVGTLAGASQLLYYAVGRVLGIEHPGGVGGNLLQAAAGPASVAIVYGVGWAYQRQALRHQAAAFDEAPRQAGIRRLYVYLVSLVALAVLAVGVAGLLWTLGDVLFSPGAASGDYWRERVALYATLAMVGLPVWLRHWRPNPTSAEETHSLARRLYVYLSLIGAMLTLVGSVAGALYRVLGLILGEGSSAAVMSDLAHAIAVASVAALLAVYHGRVVRSDARRVQPQHTTPTQTAALERLVVEIQAADADSLSRALSTLRSTGVQVTVIGTRP